MEIYYNKKHSKSYKVDTVISKGGEGEVYSIIGDDSSVAKIYFDKKFSSYKDRIEQSEKIETMIQMPVSPYVNGVLTIAWPKDSLYDASGKFVGFVMPKAMNKRPLFFVTRSFERNILFNNYNWMVSLTVAYNLATAVKILHNNNIIVSDMNTNNILVDKDGYVTIIDTDSFTIKNPHTKKIYKCTVGISQVLAPELQGKNLALPSSVFTKESDCFSLGIHIMNIIMNNTHPFGVSGLGYAQSSVSINPVAYNILHGLCPYVSGSKYPTSSEAPNINILPTEIRSLIDRSFTYTLATATTPSVIAKRPTASEWQDALFKLYSSEKTKCLMGHIYPKNYKGSCPWCEVEARIPMSYPSVSTKSFPFTTNAKVTVPGTTKPIVTNTPGSIKTTTNVINPTSSHKPCVTTTSSSLTKKKPVYYRSSKPLFFVNIGAGSIFTPTLFMSYLAMSGNIDTFRVFFENIGSSNLSFGIMIVLISIAGAVAGVPLSFILRRKYMTKKNKAFTYFFYSFLTPIIASLTILGMLV